MTEPEDLQLKHAIQLLQGEPFHWSVTFEYPGIGSVNFTDPIRSYVFGFTNATVTVDQLGADGDHTGQGVDTGLPVAGANGFSIAVQVAAAIERMERDYTEATR